MRSVIALALLAAAFVAQANDLDTRVERLAQELRCVEENGSTNNIALIKKLEGRKMAAADRLQHFDAWIDPVTHQCQQTIYMAAYNDQPTERDDIFKILAQVDPKEVVDKDAAAACKLESYESTPTYEA